MSGKAISPRGFLALMFICLAARTGLAQTTAFNYQGKLTDGGVPASGSFQMQFKLFDSLGGAGQVGSTIPDVSVTASEGMFSVSLDFGSNALSGANRWLEIAVRHDSGESYTTLSPREQIASAPYAVRTLSAASADTATNALNLGGVAANQYLQTNGNGSGLTNLNAGSIASGTLGNARLGQIPTANIADNAVSSPKIASGQVVKGVTVGASTLTDNVTLAQGSNVGITTAGNTVFISSTGGGVAGGGTANTIPLWIGSTGLGDSLITQNANGVQLPNGVQLAAGAQGNSMAFGSPNGQTGITMAGAPFARADIRFGSGGGGPAGSNLMLLNSFGGGGPPPATNGIVIDQSGNVGIGIPTNDVLFAKFDLHGDAIVRGTLKIRMTAGGGSEALCRIPSGNEYIIDVCSSSLRYKTAVQPFSSGLDLIRKLRPVSFIWKNGGMADLGLIAEEVAAVEPLLATRNTKGEIEGVKYDRLGAVFVNAFKEQQMQIEALQEQLGQQRKQIESLTGGTKAAAHRL